jgi:hypothetical protein
MQQAVPTPSDPFTSRRRLSFLNKRLQPHRIEIQSIPDPDLDGLARQYGFALRSDSAAQDAEACARLAADLRASLVPTPRRAALDYAARGWAVFPVHGIRDDRCTCGAASCNSPGKHPIGELTPHGVKDATTDAERIASWWAEYPEANIGVAAGTASGFVVVDVDEGGDDTLVGWEKEHGPLPETVESLAGGGGRHLLFAHPGVPVVNSQ